MEENLSAIEKLEKFASNTSRKVFFTEDAYPHTSMHAVTYHRRTLYIPFDSNNDCFFVCFGDSREFGNYANFSGVFFVIDKPLSEQLIVRKNDILDKIGSIFKKASLKTGNPEFDKISLIEENSTAIAIDCIRSQEVLNSIISAFKLDNLLRAGINELKIDFVPELKDKSHFGIYVINDWIMLPEKIEQVFEIANNIKRYLTK